MKSIWHGLRLEAQMSNNNWDIDINALIEEVYAEKRAAAATTLPAAKPDPEIKPEVAQQKFSEPAEETKAPETVGALSASIRALAASPALPKLLERLAGWVETLEGRDS
ncbi:MAG: hypothetical protein ABI895_29220 [Deltaproteobacteria bacterium]